MKTGYRSSEQGRDSFRITSIGILAHGDLLPYSSPTGASDRPQTHFYSHDIER